ncbi:hypothetical protein ZYGR_0AD04360 [Zygosaccharomyces rouxii]|uniref:Calcipressin-like protein n=1 Tax=Zygosaccharomyces rouxii TaxID=4956 RepID=A0A1Q3A6K3_ZYGRO|nr:hypothetical protein ZYGR_0AD04360 [Zygosaccharomyces rouxii]
METNTLIATNNSGSLAHDVGPLRNWLLKSGIGEMQLIHLPSFKRVLVVTESKEAASQLMSKKGELGDIRLRYTLTDTEGALVNPDEEMGRLQVPPHKRTFLISPPTSPPPEFDYSRCEEPPDRVGPTDLGGEIDFEESETDNEGQRTLLSSSAGTITIKPAETLRDRKQEPLPHTALPPKSIFDEE